jgi:hypothetical protein
MNIDFRKILIIILGLLWLCLTFTILYGCSANYHFTKFLNKGGKIDTISKVVTVEKTIKINGKDSIIFVQMPLNCPEVQIPPTRQEIRYKYRIQRDSIETIRYVTKWKTKEVVKVAKVHKRKPFNWFWVGLGIGIFTPILIRFVIKKL